MAGKARGRVRSWCGRVGWWRKFTPPPLGSLFAEAERHLLCTFESQMMNPVSKLHYTLVVRIRNTKGEGIHQTPTRRIRYHFVLPPCARIIKSSETNCNTIQAVLIPTFNSDYYYFYCNLQPVLSSFHVATVWQRGC